MIRLIRTGQAVFSRIERNPATVTIVSFFLILASARICPANDELAARFQKLKDQYQSIKTVHLKSQMVTKIYFERKENPLSDNATIVQHHYEYWADKDGNYRVNSSFDSNEDSGSWDFAYEGELFQVFDNRASLFRYSATEPQQNPLAPQNSLFAPLLFLGRDDDNCLACTLKLADVLDSETWQEKAANAKVITTPGQAPGQVVAEIPGGVSRGKEFVWHVYFGGDCDYLPSKINRVDKQGNIMSSSTITAYKAIDLNGKQTYWPESINYLIMDTPKVTVVEFNAQINVCQINGDLPAGIFTIDSSKANGIWDDDAGVFVKQKGL